MKRVSKWFVIMAVLWLPLSMAAQDVPPLKQENDALMSDIDKLEALILKEKEKCDSLRSSWYNTCVGYLKKGEFKADELNLLIKQTIPEIDGQELLNELIRAQKCYDEGKPYQFQGGFQLPLIDTVVDHAASSTEKQQKGKRGNDAVKRYNRNYKKYKSSAKEEPSDDNDDDMTEVPPRQEVPVKDDDTTPVSTPVVSDARSAKPIKSKEEKTGDKGEMEEGRSKKTKNSDGSI